MIASYTLWAGTDPGISEVEDAKKVDRNLGFGCWRMSRKNKGSCSFRSKSFGLRLLLLVFADDDEGQKYPAADAHEIDHGEALNRKRE